jgi:hypothetical protein
MLKKSSIKLNQNIMVQKVIVIYILMMVNLNKLSILKIFNLNKKLKTLLKYIKF